MYFGIYNSYAIKNLKLEGKKTVLIRCLSESEYLNPSLIIENSYEYSNILKLNIEDKNYLDNDNIELLIDFIINNDFDEVITHCALGLSRSPAIMICIAKILESPQMETLVKEKYRFYNKSIVQYFEKYPYRTKTVDDTEFKLRDNHLIDKNYKELVKRKNIIIS